MLLLLCYYKIGFLFLFVGFFFLFADSESTEPLSVDGISDLEGEEGEEDMGTSMPEGEIPQIPDQEKFLKQHFGTLGSTDGKGTAVCSLKGVARSLQIPLYKSNQAGRLSWGSVYEGAKMGNQCREA